MTKLKYDKKGITNIIKPSIKKSIADLDNAISKTNIKAPSDFQYTEYIKKLSTKLTTYKTKLQDESKWIDESIEKIDHTLNSLRIEAKQLPETSITEIKPNISV